MDPAHVPLDTLLAHRDWVRAVAHAVVRDPNAADDVEQETWLAALRTPPRHAGSLRGWLGAVARSRARRIERSDVRRNAREAASARGEETPSAAQLAEIADTHRRVVQAVVALDEPYRETILLRFFEGLPVADVASRTGVPLETTRARLRRGVAKLRERLARELGTDERPGLLALAPLIQGTRGGAAGTGAAVGGGIVMAATAKWVIAAGLVGAAAWWTLAPSASESAAKPVAPPAETAAAPRARPSLSAPRKRIAEDAAESAPAVRPEQNTAAVARRSPPPVMDDPSGLSVYTDAYGFSVTKPSADGWKFVKADFAGPRVALRYAPLGDRSLTECIAHFNVQDAATGGMPDVSKLVGWATGSVLKEQLEVDELRPAETRQIKIGGLNCTALTARGDGKGVKAGWGGHERRFYFVEAGGFVIHVDALVRLGVDTEVKNALWNAIESMVITPPVSDPTAPERSVAERLSDEVEPLEIADPVLVAFGRLSDETHVPIVVSAEAAELIAKHAQPPHLLLDGSGKSMLGTLMKATSLDYVIEDARVVIVPSGGNWDATKPVIVPPVPPRAARITVLGRVTDANGVAIAGAEVVRMDSDLPRAVTDVAGRYELRLRPPYGAVQARMDGRTSSAAVAIEGAANAQVTADLTLGGSAGSLRVRVTDDGKPMELHAFVQLGEASGFELRGPGSTVRRRPIAATDDHDEVLFRGVPAGETAVTVSCIGFVGKTVTVAVAAGRVNEIEVTLAHPVPLKERVAKARLSLRFQETRLEDALEYVHTATGISFAFTPSLAERQQSTTLSFRLDDAPLTDALSQIARELGGVYELDENANLVVFREAK